MELNSIDDVSAYIEYKKEYIVDVWSRWYPNLETHEKGHGNFAKLMVKKIDEKLNSICARSN